MIRLKPPYELYNMILGKPVKKHELTNNPNQNPEHYMRPIIDEITILLNVENITFQQIKTSIANKFPNMNYIVT